MNFIKLNNNKYNENDHKGFCLYNDRGDYNITHNLVRSHIARRPSFSRVFRILGKAMREMLFNTMCLENEKYHVMHYAPGVLNTAMQADARANTGDPDLKEMLTGRLRVISCNVSKRCAHRMTYRD